MELRGRTVAVVGAAGYLDTSGLGAEIDSADVVVRVNWTLPIRPEYAEHVGSRTEILYHCLSCYAEIEAGEAAGVRLRVVYRTYRKELARRIGGRGWQKYRPNSGVVAIYHLLDEGAAEVRAYGLDFFASGYTKAEAVVRQTVEERGHKVKPSKKWDHDPEQDKRALRALAKSEPRFRPDAAMRNALGI